MFKIIAIVLVAAMAVSAEPKAEAKPGLLAAAYTAPLVSAPFVAATSSQVVHRNYNGLVSAPLVSAGYAAAPFAAYTAAAGYPYAAPYAAYPYAAPYAAYAGAAPLRYTAAGVAPIVL